jgi:hypothetical protein
MGNYQKLGVLVLFAIVLISMRNMVPNAPGTRVKELLTVQLAELEKEMSLNKEELNSLKRVVVFKEAEEEKTNKTLFQKDAELAKKQTKIDEINAKLKEALQKYNSEVEAREKLEKSAKTPIGQFQGDLINGIYVKTIIKKENPEYEKIIYTSTVLDYTLNDMIIMTSIGDKNSYGEGGKFEDFVKVIGKMDFDVSKTTLGLLIGSKEEFAAVQEFIEKGSLDGFYSKIILVQSEFIEKLHVLDRDERHNPKFQKERRRVIARSRNFLVTHTLGDERYSLCLDSDMIELPKNMLTIFKESKLDIVTPRITHDMAWNYDFNAWSGKRREPNEEESRKLDLNDPEFVFVPGGVDSIDMGKYGKEEYGNTGEPNFQVPLDSVGGAVLFLKSEIFKQGILFPPLYIVGTKWNRFEGYDGIETEGLCYQARTIGYSCHGMPNVVAKHVVDLS